MCGIAARQLFAVILVDFMSVGEMPLRDDILFYWGLWCTQIIIDIIK